jgi:hypothetical protein
MDVPVVVSYSAAESENDQEVFNEYLGIKIYKVHFLLVIHLEKQISI